MRRSDQLTIFDEIVLEREWQDTKYGSLDERNPTVKEWLDIMHSELLEVYFAKTENKRMEELLQVVAVGVACLEQYGVVRRPELAERE